MFYTTFRIDPNGKIGLPIWNDYVNIDYGIKVPEKGYKGFRTYLADISGAEHVRGSTKAGFTLTFLDEEKYAIFLMKYA